MAILVIAEHNNQALGAASRNVITAALELDSAIDVLIAGADCNAVAQEAAHIAGLRSVLLADSPEYGHGLVENLAPLISGESPEYNHILAAATNSGKNILPAVAALLDVQPVTDVVSIVDTQTFIRPIYAGNAMVTVRSADTHILLTVRTAAFEAAPDGEASCPITTLETSGDKGLSEFVGHEIARSERPELTAARIVISGGRGMQSAEKFHILDPVADKLNAAIGASRAAVDAGFVPNNMQVGQTGKVVAPDLYIAVGISGAIQHLAGMKDSKVIVAINKDEEAPIFQVADYGLVADLFDAIPELDRLLE
ncbi:MAG TPA: electron transfer flavoprotein subunit alpha/FixB family protein [Gammaproteobacteria bacterium]|nr:electron transfer flavoprotein subunit alpha/FixB family protein [Gammaproteobacteria bacterium]